jgi:hypothetical protein
MQIEERKAKTDHTRSLIHHYYTDLLQSMKKERRFLRKEFVNNYKLGNPAAVRGLKYDQESDTFTARCVYKVFHLEFIDNASVAFLGTPAGLLCCNNEQ